MFKESSKRRGVFRTQASIYDGAFLRIYLAAYYFHNESFIIDVQLVYLQASENIHLILQVCTYLLSTFQSHTRPQILSLISVTLSHISDVLQYPPIKSYLNQCFQVNQLLKYDDKTMMKLRYDGIIEIFQRRVLVEMWGPPECFV